MVCNEKTHRWAKWPSAKITFFNYNNKYENGIKFKLNAIDKGKYKIILNDNLIYEGLFEEVGKYSDIKIDKKHTLKNKNELIIKTIIKEL